MPRRFGRGVGLAKFVSMILFVDTCVRVRLRTRILYDLIQEGQTVIAVQSGRPRYRLYGAGAAFGVADTAITRVAELLPWHYA